MDQPDTSDVLRELLVRQGMTRGRLAGPVARRNKSPASSTNALDGGVVTDIPREEDTRHRPLPRSVIPGKLKLVVSNRCLDTAGPTRSPRVVVSKHLVLVWSEGHLVTRRP